MQEPMEQGRPCLVHAGTPRAWARTAVQRTIGTVAIALGLAAALQAPAVAKLTDVGHLDLVCRCASRGHGKSWRSHARYVRCVAKAGRSLVRHGFATAEDVGARVAVAQSSPCGRPENECETRDRPCPAGTFCDGAWVRPGSPAVGMCVPIPSMCSAEDRPACGVDGRTYANQCERLRAAVYKEDFRGPCPIPCGGPAHVACPAGRVCDCLAVCGARDEWGHCVLQPVAECANPPAGVFTVLGCDGARYAGLCEAWKNGVTVRSGRRERNTDLAPYCLP